MSCSDSDCGCDGGWPRREFLKLGGAVAVTALTARAGAEDSSAAPDSSAGIIPADKNLDPAWLRSLTARGDRTVYRGKDLAKIGLPVGGICAGQLYVGGDGKLWHWDIFNQHIATGDAHYAHPPEPDYPIDQGFALRITQRGKSQVRTLDKTGFSNISFIGEYPIGFVDYVDEKCPVTVALEAFSPFIPLNTFDSSLPATVMQYTVKNTSGVDAVDVELVGWLRNAVGLSAAKQLAFVRRNEQVSLPGGGEMILCSAREAKPDEAPAQAGNRALHVQADFGTMGLALLENVGDEMFAMSLPEGEGAATVFGPHVLKPRTTPVRASGLRVAHDTYAEVNSSAPPPRAAIGRKLTLKPREKATITFVLTWCFPNLPHPADKNMTAGNYYAKHFSDAAAVARYIADNFPRLSEQTRLWHRTWYDSTLPYWALDRTFINSAILATSTCRRWRNGRFWCWEGVGCCIGTCTHVWHYAHAAARLFPELERSTREIQDLDTGFDENTGGIGMRGEFQRLSATDGQTGTILRIFREHQMSADDDFLNRNWPRIKKAVEFLVRQDGNDDGILEGDQPNTLDTSYFGPNSTISSLYLASVRAAQEMAREVGDASFAERLGRIFQTGAKRLVDLLFNGEYFIQLPDPNHPDALKTGQGCFIDQVFGQSWAWQVGLGRILPRDKTLSALQSLWKYNFAPDVGPYRAVYKPGRWYAMPGEAGLIMCTWPRGGYEQSRGKVNPGFAAYLNECMNGFEYQAAGHMIWEGMLTEGLAITRALHDRYHGSKRNPWNEVECGDHYARSMASYGVFLALCGYEHHGPDGYLAFAPRISPHDFRAAFNAAQGWGTFEQKRTGAAQRELIRVAWGHLRLRKLKFEIPPQISANAIRVSLDGADLTFDKSKKSDSVEISFAEEVFVKTGSQLTVVIQSD